MRKSLIYAFLAMTILLIFVPQTDALFREKSIVMCPYKDSILVALGEGKNYRAYNFEKGLARVEASQIVYEGNSPITAMIPYKEGVLTALTNVENKGNLSRIHWSKDGRNLGNAAYSPVVYEGNSPVTALLPYKNGVIVAMYNVGNRAGWNEIHYYDNWDPTKGDKLQKSDPHTIDAGASEVTAMIAYENGILVAFKNVENNKKLNSVHSCDCFDPNKYNAKNGKSRTIGGCHKVYIGNSPVTAMINYKNGVLTALTNHNNGENDNRVYFSPDGESVGNQSNTNIRYPYRGIGGIANAPVYAFAIRGDYLLTAFRNWQGIDQVVIKSTNVEGNLAAGDTVYTHANQGLKTNK